MIWKYGIGCTLALGLAVLGGCGDDGSSTAGGTSKPSTASKPATPTTQAKSATAGAEPAAPLSHEELVAAGRSAYNANCIACHSMNPAQDGALGPAVAGASEELLASRILRAEYPEGYVPKRNTRVMVALPHLEPQIPALAAYLDSVE